MNSAPELDDEGLAQLASSAHELGLLRLAAVDLAHPGFGPAHAALDAQLDAGAQGEMGFMTRTREVRKAPAQMLEGARTVLIALVPYRGEAGPVARYAQSADYHTHIHRRWLEFTPALEAALPGVQSLICVDTKPLLERAVAVLGGLGFLGKNGMLITPGLGSYVLLGAMLITAPYTGTQAAPAWVKQGAPAWQACGTCRRCLDACPTQAFIGPGELDPRRCISYLSLEYRGEIEPALSEQMGVRIAGCDVCQEVCPYNASPDLEARVPLHAWLPPAPGRDRSPDLAKLANVGNNQHRGFVKHTALNRVPRRALRRNAIIALGNKSAKLEGREREALEDASKDADEGLAELARAALARRRHPELG